MIIYHNKLVCFFFSTIINFIYRALHCVTKCFTYRDLISKIIEDSPDYNKYQQIIKVKNQRKIRLIIIIKHLLLYEVTVDVLRILNLTARTPLP